MTLDQTLQEAPFVPDGWDIALRRLAADTGSARGQLLGLHPRHASFCWLTDTSPDYLDEFLAIGADRPEVNWRIAASRPAFELVHEHHYGAIQALGVDDAYAEHTRRYDGEFGCQTALIDDANAYFGLAVIRAAADGKTTEEQRAVFARAAVQALASVRTQHALENQSATLLQGSLDSMRVAAILLDRSGMVCAMTPAMDSILGRGAIRIAGRRVVAATKSQDGMLQRQIADALANRPGCRTPELWIDRDGRVQALVEVHALPTQNWSFGFAPAVVLSFRTPMPLSDHDAAAIAAALGLSAAEGEIMALLVAGVSRARIAQVRGTTLLTVASQMKTIFRKLGVRREAELIALVLSIR